MLAEESTGPNIRLPIPFLDSIAEARTMEDIVEASALWLPRVLGAARVTISVMRDGVLRAHRYAGRAAIDAGHVFDLDNSAAGDAIRTGQPQVFDDLGLSLLPEHRRLREIGLASACVVPMLWDGEVLGTLHASNGKRAHFSPSRVRAMHAVSRLIGCQMRIHRQMEELHRLSRTDPLTGAANRRTFLEQAEDALLGLKAGGPGFALVVLDFDHFKQINDRHGHAAGDLALRSAVDALTGALRAQDLLARIGGEEFAILLEDVALEDAHRMADGFRATVEALDLHLADTRFGCTISAGLAVARPEDADTGRILSRADAALYRAKGAGRNRVVCAA